MRIDPQQLDRISKLLDVFRVQVFTFPVAEKVALKVWPFWPPVPLVCARRRCSSAVPCEQLIRTHATPAASSRSSTPGASHAGPSVATIFVRRPSITAAVSQASDRGSKTRASLSLSATRGTSSGYG